MQDIQPESLPAVVVTSSHVARGTVGNRAAVFALETLGFRVWAVPTIILPWHPGHGPATRIVPDVAQFAAMMSDLTRAPWLGEVGAVMSGYLGHPGQAGPIARFVEAVKARRPDARYLCDPVIGDGSGLYVKQETAEAIRDELMPLADIATPNRFELEWLSGRGLPDLEDLSRAAREAAPPTMLVTSAPGSSEGHIGNLLLTDDLRLLAEHERHAKAPNGVGDLMATLFLAGVLARKPPRGALRDATATVSEVLGKAIAREADELMLAADVQGIRRPGVPIYVRDLDRPEGEPLAGIGATTVAGVDGCKAGWVAVISRPGSAPSVDVFRTFASLVDALPEDAIIAVDMPIGLPERTGRGGREPEMLARPHLDQRQSSVFSIPSRSAIYAETAEFSELEAWYAAHRRASEVARATSDPPRGISIQAFGIFSKIREIDELLLSRPELRRRVIESHPEVAFWRLNDEVAMSRPKKVRGRVNPAGMAERRDLLVCQGLPPALLEAPPPRGVGEDDLLDAAAMLLVAARHAAGKAIPFPDPPGSDGKGIPVAIWS